MPRLISLTDDRKRDAQVEIERAKRGARHSYVNGTGEAVRSKRFIKATEGHDTKSLLAAHDGDLDALGQALVDGDPELDVEIAGRLLGDVDRVWVREDGSVLYAARALMVRLTPDGEEVSRADFVDVEATVNDEAPLLWSGRLFPVTEVVRRFALVRKLQLRHINGLTYDFLYEIAKTLQESGKMLFVGSGAKANQPLIFQTNGSPYRGFLEGRVEENGYRLILHLSNLELKSVTTEAE